MNYMCNTHKTPHFHCICITYVFPSVTSINNVNNVLFMKLNQLKLGWFMATMSIIHGRSNEYTNMKTHPTTQERCSTKIKIHNLLVWHNSHAWLKRWTYLFLKMRHLPIHHFLYPSHTNIPLCDVTDQHSFISMYLLGVKHFVLICNIHK